ncbi:RPM1 interacting protein 13 [Zea mays]|uniref:RPM1 interacting protein 13 n=1 Tax=Zea mays TaxID=4577 RepID=A0A1D6P6G7_MAIZE|nr:RPM1 interacting protein 13 [Zea mays]
MANVKRSTPVTVPAPAPAPAPLDPGATAAMAKKSASTGAAITATKSPAAASPLIVIEIPSSPDASTGGRRSTTKARKRPALWPLVLDDEIEMWTPREKRRLDEDCQILAGDPLASNIEVAPAAASDEIAVVAERGKIACRDYPHPRSACAKHPFSRTPHERYCDQALVGTAVLRGEMEMWNNKVMKGLIIIAALCSNLSETSDSLETA